LQPVPASKSQLNLTSQLSGGRYIVPETDQHATTPSDVLSMWAASFKVTFTSRVLNPAV
jgi:hypothetical protein